MGKKLSNIETVDALCNVTRRRRRTWLATLTEEQQQQCSEVRDRVQAESLPANTVARNLIEHFELAVSTQTVAKWLTESPA